MFQLPRIMGHRGAAGTAPENTLAGLRMAAEQGAQWIEFDVMLSGDGVPVLFHDDSLKRTTGSDALMADTPLADLRKLEAGAWFAPEFAGEPIPTLQEALRFLLDSGLSPNVEIKPSRGKAVPTGRAVAEVMAQFWPLDRSPALICAFGRDCLAIARDLAPQVPRAFLMRRPHRDWRAVAKTLKCSTIHIGGRWLSASVARDIKDAGYGLAAFTVNDPARARLLLERGVDCIITDVPGKIAATLA